eukprot:TRINITY_DN51406_c0_g1_i1.p1 TRINITY_DN51406_c0_g1~~TRINITY_DN51406_c0_g1_i1.p1  ORF type:complete len:333 (+),score=17.14 TRINITY_DN51406_c0_g1_i1:98-1000(+)
MACWTPVCKMFRWCANRKRLRANDENADTVALKHAEPPQPCHSSVGVPVCALFDIAHMTDMVALASCDPVLVTRLALVDRQRHGAICGGVLVRRVAEELGSKSLPWATACETYEQIALGLDVAQWIDAKPNRKAHVSFMYGGGIQVQRESLPLFDYVEKLTKRFGRLQIHADVHTGLGAPFGTAKPVASARGLSIRRELVRRSLDPSRISVKAWGRKITSRWSESEYTAARGELYFRLGAVEFPDRPAYYDLVNQPSAEPVSDSEDSSEDFMLGVPGESDSASESDASADAESHDSSIED